MNRILKIIIQIMREIKQYIKLKSFQIKWRKENKHNYTNAGNIFPIDKVKVGKYTYGTLNVNYYYNDSEFLKIGNYCSIANEVQFFTGGNHNYKNLTTFPLKNILTKNKIKEATTKGKIIIEDDVWIGYRSIILSGVTIGKGAVIGAGSVVASDIPPYAIYVRNRVIKYRFNKNIIEKLEKIDFDKLNLDYMNKKLEFLYTEITEDNIDKILGELIDEF